MKNLKWKPTLEALEGRLAMSANPWAAGPLGLSSGGGRPTDEFSLNVRAAESARPADASALSHVYDADLTEMQSVFAVWLTVGVREQPTAALQVGNGFGDVLYVCVGDGGARLNASLVASPEYFRAQTAPHSLTMTETLIAVHAPNGFNPSGTAGTVGSDHVLQTGGAGRFVDGDPDSPLI